MDYNIRETNEAINDVSSLAAYMIEQFANHKAALDFLDRYDLEALRLTSFPFGYRGISIEYRGYEIRIKPFDTYNMFFIVDTTDNIIYILRVLKNLQNWQEILRTENQYHF